MVVRSDSEPAPAAAQAKAAAAAARISSPPAVASDAATLANAAAVEGNLISIDEFLRVDLRVAKVLNAELVAGAGSVQRIVVDRDRFLARAALRPG